MKQITLIFWNPNDGEGIEDEASMQDFGHTEQEI